ncbi:hypothetical protein JD79_01180 [Geodermatophilus normandii]|uniref:Uncharacterized protein n=1 Tax=Geodermatophilus normandii TaxID=1137989 RepID=A0A317QGV0_9ACTN|nr:hypothetical protein JD79_01180 [Geodermatophilus normandii]
MPETPASLLGPVTAPITLGSLPSPVPVASAPPAPPAAARTRPDAEVLVVGAGRPG